MARGYLKDDAQTAEKFLPDPFSAEPGARMYKTGDLARWREDGVVEFLGRIDNQVKIHGYRIEPGEIEIALRTHKIIHQACVVPHTDETGVKRLVAYFTTAGNSELSGKDVKQFLSGKIPAAHGARLVCSDGGAAAFSQWKGRPGRVACAGIRKGRSASAARNAATELEGQVAEVWKRVLRVERAGLDDNFFDLGGDSLLLLAVHSNLQKTLHIEIPITDLFEFTTVRTLAARLIKQQPAPPSFSDVQQQAQKQREAFARERERRSGGAS